MDTHKAFFKITGFKIPVKYGLRQSAKLDILNDDLINLLIFCVKRIRKSYFNIM
jgi:hypothetical protein